ncbi:MAG: protein TolQ, partial [Chromatiales bacterium]|nr:protein TolQ [Chromatiales bacterium]
MGEVGVNMGFWELISQATVLVQLIMGLLLAASILSWIIILQRRVILSGAERDLSDFEQAFKQRDSLESLFVALSRNKSRSTTGMAWVFEAGMREFHRQAARGKTDPERLVE